MEANEIAVLIRDAMHEFRVKRGAGSITDAMIYVRNRYPGYTPKQIEAKAKQVVERCAMADHIFGMFSDLSLTISAHLQSLESQD